MITLIVAKDQDGLIGANNRLPWYNKEELNFFRNKTSHEIVVMGRKAWESFGSRPLPYRHNIILTRDPYLDVGEFREEVTVCSCPEEVIALYEHDGIRNLYVMGGKEAFEAFKPYYTHAVVSTVYGTFTGDTYIDLKSLIGNARSYHTFHGDGYRVDYYEVNRHD